MHTAETTIISKTELHARYASHFAFRNKECEPKTTFRDRDVYKDAVGAKSIARILAEDMGQGTRIEISACGDDEQAAAEALKSLVDGGFGER